MDSGPAFDTKLPDYSIRRLTPEDTGALQRLYDKCADYTWIVEGEPVSPTAAQEDMQAVPPGRSLSDKFLFGLIDSRSEIAGMLEGMRHYPDQGVWWIGLLLLAPEVRNQGIGRQLLSGFFEYVRSQGGNAVMLGVVEDNTQAYRFWQHTGFERVRQTDPHPFGKKMQLVYVMRLEMDKERTD